MKRILNDAVVAEEPGHEGRRLVGLDGEQTRESLPEDEGIFVAAQRFEPQQKLCLARVTAADCSSVSRSSTGRGRVIVRLAQLPGIGLR